MKYKINPEKVSPHGIYVNDTKEGKEHFITNVQLERILNSVSYKIEKA